jgi:predicted helicase
MNPEYLRQYNINDFLTELSKIPDEVTKGNLFEKFCLQYLKYQTRSRTDIKRIYLSKDSDEAFWEHIGVKRVNQCEIGIDIIVEYIDGSILAVQCKYSKAKKLSNVSTFYGFTFVIASSRNIANYCIMTTYTDLSEISNVISKNKVLVYDRTTLTSEINLLDKLDKFALVFELKCSLYKAITKLPPRIYDHQDSLVTLLGYKCRI